MSLELKILTKKSRTESDYAQVPLPVLQFLAELMKIFAGLELGNAISRAHAKLIEAELERRMP